MDPTISFDSVIIVFALTIFLVVSHLEGKISDAVHELRREYRVKIAELRSENRELRHEVRMLKR